jgi:hypothetical protein
MTNPTMQDTESHSATQLYMTYILSDLQRRGLSEKASRIIDELSRELDVDQMDVIVSWLNEMSELHDS